MSCRQRSRCLPPLRYVLVRCAARCVPGRLGKGWPPPGRNSRHAKRGGRPLAPSTSDGVAARVTCKVPRVDSNVGLFGGTLTNHESAATVAVVAAVVVMPRKAAVPFSGLRATRRVARRVTLDSAARAAPSGERSARSDARGPETAAACCKPPASVRRVGQVRMPILGCFSRRRRHAADLVTLGDAEPGDLHCNPICCSGNWAWSVAASWHSHIAKARRATLPARSST